VDRSRRSAKRKQATSQERHSGSSADLNGAASCLPLAGGENAIFAGATAGTIGGLTAKPQAALAEVDYDITRPLLKRKGLAMAEQQPSRPLSAAEISSRLHEIAKLLRSTHHLGTEAQEALAQLADELGDSWTPAAESAPLLESTTHVVQALRHGQATGPLSGARQRLEETAAAMEARAPGAADFARRLLDTLANLGI
jgi:hypothetical protein